jgi:hypothetical protein
MTLRAIHSAFRQGVMLWQVELGVYLKVAIETWAWVFSRIHNELAAPASSLNVFAPWAVAGFTSGSVRKLRISEINPAVRAGCKVACNVRMAVITSRISDVRSARHFHGSHDGASQRRT